MASGLITQIIDRGAIEQEKAYLAGKIKEIEQMVSAAKTAGISILNANSVREFNTAIAAMSKAQVALAKETANLSKARMDDAKAAQSEAQASLNAAKAKTEETKQTLNAAKAKKLEEQYIRSLEKEKERLNKAALKEADRLEKLNNAYEQLKAKYTIAANTAKQLAAAKGLDNAETQEAVAAAQKYYQQLLKIEQAVGQAQRNVGNYTQATFALTQVIREAPAFANSFATGISAISNNLPILIDEINKLREANKALAANGQQTVSVFKTLAKGVFSLTGLLPILFLIIQLFGKEIVEFAKGLFGAADNTKLLTRQLADLGAESERAKLKLAALREQAQLLKEIGDITGNINFSGTDTGDFIASRLAGASDIIDADNQIYDLTEEITAANKRASDSYKIFKDNAGSAADEAIRKYTFLTSIPDDIADEFTKADKKRFESAKKLEQDLLDLEKQKGKADGNRRILIAKENEKIDAENKRLEKEAIAAAIARYEKEKKAALEYSKYVIGLEIERQKQIIAISEGQGERATRRDAVIAARKKQADLEIELINMVSSYEIAQGNAVSREVLRAAVVQKLGRAALTQAEEAIIDEAYKKEVEARRLSAKEIDLINYKMAIDTRLALLARDNDIADAARRERNILMKEAAETSRMLSESAEADRVLAQERLLADRERAIEASLNALDDQLTQELRRNVEAYNEGEINKEKFEENKLKIESSYARKSLEAQLQYYTNLALISGLPVEVQKKIAEEIQRIQKALNEADIKQTQTTADKKTQIYQAYKDAIVALNKELVGLVGDLLTAQLERQRNAIQDEIDLLEARRQKETEVVNQTVTDRQEAAAEIAIINARADQERIRLEMRQRQIRQEQARYERAQTIAEIIQNTAVAVTAQLKIPGAGIGLAAVIAALGAAQIARVLATPIPKYAEGTDNHPGGMAIVGDGGRPEGIELPDGTRMKTPSSSTLVDLPKGTKVHKHYQNMMLDATITKAPIFAPRNDTTELTLRTVGKNIVSAIKHQPRPIVKGQGRFEVMTQIGHSYYKTINSQLQG